MSKYLFMGIATAALLTTGCTNNEIIEIPASSAITFSDVYVEGNTKTDITTNNIENFLVYGYVTTDNDNDTYKGSRIFNGTKVEKSDNVWKYDNTQYWIEGGNYLFSAIAPAENNNVSNISTSVADEKKSITTTFNFTNNGNIDLLYDATGVLNAAEAKVSNVTMEFKHILSKIKFTFENTCAQYSNIYIKVTDVLIEDAYETGSVKLKGNHPSKNRKDIVWTPTGNKEKKLSFGNVVTSTNNSEATLLAPFKDSNYIKSASTANEIFLIPTATFINESEENKIEYTVKFKVEVYQGEQKKFINEKHLEAKISGIEFIPGYSYNFTAALNENNIDPSGKLQEIDFTVSSVEGWTSENKTLTVPSNNTTTSDQE